MSSPLPRPAPRRGRDPKSTYWEPVKDGQRVYAPRAGTLRKRKGGLAVVTPSGYVHRLYGVKARKKLLGKKIADGRWVGEVTARRVVYKRRNPAGKQLATMYIVEAPVRPPREKYVPAWEGYRVLTCGWAYSSGRPHRAEDRAMPKGTPICSPIDGVVVDVNDGVPDNPPGYVPPSGTLGNHVVIFGKDRHGQKVSVFFNHFGRGLKVRKGQKILAGKHLGDVSLSGRTNGYHTHFSVVRGWNLNRYASLWDASLAYCMPSKLWNNR